MKSSVILVSLLFCLVSIAASRVRADVPVPPRVLAPHSIDEAWNVIRLATANVERLLRDGRSGEVADQISLCSAALRLIARTPVPGIDQIKRDDQTSRAFRAVNLIARDSMAGNAQGVANVFAALQKTLQELAQGFEKKTLDAEIYHCTEHPDVISTDAAQLCSTCKRALHARRIPYSFIYVQPDSPTVRASAKPAAPLAKGNESMITLQLQSLGGKPLPPSEFIVTHMHPVHVIIADEKLADYHFTHAIPGGKDGEYSVTFTPALDASYRLWAAVVPCTTGLQEYAAAEINSSGKDIAPLGITDTHTASAGGYQFQIAFPSGSRSSLTSQAGSLQMMRLLVTDGAGQQVTTLEPFMQAFAHITGIYENQQTVFQLHPTGGDVLLETQRGGPMLSFKFFPPKPGHVKLLCTVRIAGKQITAPFVISVTPPAR